MIVKYLLGIESARPGSQRVRMLSTGVALIVVVIWTPTPVDARSGQSPPIMQQVAAYGPPSSLVEIGDAAAQLFDAARLSNWSDADGLLQTMNTLSEELPTTWSTPDLAKRLSSRLAEVNTSVSARQRVQTMDFANGITRLVADLSSGYGMPVPYALVLLDYYGRELELGTAADDPIRLARATADLQQTWNRFESTILQAGAVDEARRFTDSVAQLMLARVPGDFVAPTRAALAAVGAMKKLFKP